MYIYTLNISSNITHTYMYIYNIYMLYRGLKMVGATLENCHFSLTILTISWKQNRGHAEHQGTPPASPLHRKGPWGESSSRNMSWTLEMSLEIGGYHGTYRNSQIHGEEKPRETRGVRYRQHAIVIETAVRFVMSVHGAQHQAAQHQRWFATWGENHKGKSA